MIKKLFLVFVVLLFVVNIVFADSAVVAPYPVSITGGTGGGMNLTANMTMNLTANMTANMTSGPNNDPWYLWINGTRAMTGLLNMGGFNISSLLDPVAPQDAATKNYVDLHSSNLSSVYPIGSVYITTNTSNPHDIFGGFGTWEDLGTGYVLVGV